MTDQTSHHEPSMMDMVAHRAAWSSFVSFIQYSGLLACLLTAHITMTAALGIDWMVSLVAVAVVGVIARKLMQMRSAFYAYLAGACGAILFAHVMTALAAMLFS